jgi:acetyl esterase
LPRGQASAKLAAAIGRIMNYGAIIDAATWGFIRASEAEYPPDTASLTVADQRAIYDRLCRAFHQGYPPGVTAEDRPIAGVPCRIYAGSAPALLYLHGGGFVVGGLDSHDDVCAEICGITGLTVVAADYRLSPEHLHPAAFDDACAVARALGAEGPILLAGDSAGANLAAAAAHALRHEIALLGQVLIYPGLGGDLNRGSYLTHAQAPMLTRDDVLYYRDIRHGHEPPSGDPTVSPLQDRDFTHLPPSVTFGAECDPLCDDARTYAEAITRAGGRAHFILEPGLVHGFLRARAMVPRAAAAFTRITTALSALARGDWPYGDST